MSQHVTEEMLKRVNDRAAEIVQHQGQCHQGQRFEFTLARAAEALVAEKGARAALETALACARARFAAAELSANQLKEQLQQSNADALKKMHIKVDGQLHSTMVWKRHSPMVFVNVHPSSGSHVVLLPKHDGKSEGGQQEYQCSVCGTGLKRKRGA